MTPVRNGPWRIICLGLSPLPGFQSPPGWHYIFRIGNPELNLLFHYYWEGGQPNICHRIILVEIRGRDSMLEGKDYTWYISGIYIYCQLGDNMLPIPPFYKNLTNLLNMPWLQGFILEWEKGTKWLVCCSFFWGGLWKKRPTVLFCIGDYNKPL